MPSLGDSAVIILLGLLLFGPKGLAQIARQLGKLMGEFRRASNEFRMQMEEELRLSEQSDRQKEIAAIEAAAPVPAPILETAAPELAEPDAQFRSIHPDHMPSETGEVVPGEVPEAPGSETEPLPIAVSGDLKIMPPATGLPQPRTSQSLGALVDSIPHEESEALPDPATPAGSSQDEYSDQHVHLDQQPNRYTNGHTDENGLTPANSPAPEESLHG